MDCPCSLWRATWVSSLQKFGQVNDVSAVKSKARGLRDRSKAGRLRDLLFFNVDVAAIKETHFVCAVDVRVLSSDLFSIQYTGTNRPRCFLAG